MARLSEVFRRVPITGTIKTLAAGVKLGDLVLGYAAKFDLLATQLEWPVQNLLSNRYAYRDDMIRAYTLVAVLINEGSFLSQLFYELPSKQRDEHMTWLEKEPG